MANKILRAHSISEVAKQSPFSFFKTIKADLIANGGAPSSLRFFRLLLTHSGCQLLLIFRLQSCLKGFDNIAIAFLRSVLMKVATDLTGCHVAPDAHLEAGISLPHATGIVIGEGVIIHKNVTIYQNVTLGIAVRGEKNYPELFEGSIVYCGAQVLGKITIGVDAIVGANAVVLQSVPDNALAVGIPARIIQK
ncbi:MAG: serine O-acetyltransferase [Elainellaceae cyanobacterium]